MRTTILAMSTLLLGCTKTDPDADSSATNSDAETTEEVEADDDEEWQREASRAVLYCTPNGGGTSPLRRSVGSPIVFTETGY